MLSWMIWIAMGVLVGWVASLAMAAHSQQRTLLNVLWAVVGAAIGGGLFASNPAASVVAALLGAVVFVASMEFVREVTA
ncbi:MAG: GlsB/YeaQ/YmgE family stress response membrane protein [Deltaproteobacteria bacterium]|nr:GlsB/YeaQ/YmgE family stress response membrane protein [Deltaproteobacteria bacterium]